MANTISPELLRQRLTDDDVTLIDTRAAEDFESWHIPGARNFPFSPNGGVDAAEFKQSTGLEEGDSIVTVCALGKSSYAFADRLNEIGFDEVQVVQDGMQGWSRVYALASIPTATTSLEIFQIQRVAKGCLGYVIGSPTSGEAIVVDPTRHIDEYRRVAADDDMEITRVIDTHIHADHISGGRRLADEEQATYHLPARATSRNVNYDFVPLEHAEVIPLGDLELKAIHTPGHTTESLSLLVGAEAILTADTVFVDGVGRTELQFGEGEAASGAQQLYQSIQRSILTLPDPISVLPGHFSSEATDALDMVGGPIQTTVKDLRTGLSILEADEETFVDRLTASIPEKPPNYEQMMAINRGDTAPEDESEASELELGPNRCAAEAD